MTQASRTPIEDLTAGWWYRARVRRCETEKAVNCGYWSLPVVSHFPTIVKTKCGPALALGASQAVDLTPDDPSKDFKYPKLNIAWNEIFIRYEAAIGEGLSPENAFARANQGWAGEEEYIISEPDSKFPQHRIHGYIEFVRPSNFNESTAIKLLRDFLASQGISEDVRNVFGDFYFNPGDASYPGIDDLMIPFTLVGPLSELPEIDKLILNHFPIVELDNLSSVHLHQNRRGDSQTTSPTTNNSDLWHGADVWHTAGYTGDGIKIGVIDGDFDGLIVY